MWLCRHCGLLSDVLQALGQQGVGTGSRVATVLSSIVDTLELHWSMTKMACSDTGGLLVNSWTDRVPCLCTGLLSMEWHLC